MTGLGGVEEVWGAASEVGAGFGDLQPLEVVVLLLQSRVQEECHRGMSRVGEGLILRVSSCLGCLSESEMNSGPLL